MLCIWLGIKRIKKKYFVIRQKPARIEDYAITYYEVIFDDYSGSIGKKCKNELFKD
jgi:hypothetical protein